MKYPGLRLFTLLILAILALALFPTGQKAQISSGTAFRVRSGTALPATCNPGPSTTDVFIRTDTDLMFLCASTNVWTQVGGGGGSGTVNSGTAKRFAHYAATGTTVSDTPGVEYQSGASPNVSITAQSTAHVALQIKPAADTGLSNSPVEISNVAGNFIISFDPTGDNDAAIAITSNISNTNIVPTIAVSNLFTGSGGNAIVQISSKGTANLSRFYLSSDSGLVGQIRLNGVGNPDSNLSNISSSMAVTADSGVSGGLIISAGHSTAPIIFGTGGVAFSNERLRIAADGAVHWNGQAAPAVSAAGDFSIYSTTAGVAKISENGAAYVNLVGGATGANPTATIGLSAVNGSDNTAFVRRDGAPALSQAIAPTWTANHIWTPITASSSTIRINDTNGAPQIQIGTYPASSAYGGVWFGNVTPSGTNYSILGSGASELLLNVPNSTGAFYFRAANASQFLTLTESRVQLSSFIVDERLNLFGAGSGNSYGFGIKPLALSFYVGGNTSRFAFLDDSAGSNELLTITGTGLIGVNKSSSQGAQFHVVSASPSRIGVRIDSLANSTVDLAQFNLNADDTSTVANLATFAANSNGTAATGFGQSLTFNLESSTTNDVLAARLDVLWADATHATRTSDIVFTTVNSATTQESFRITGNALPVWPNTVTAGGTTGAQTIHKPSGTVNFAATETTLVVTNNLVTTSSIVFAIARTNDTTCMVKDVELASGSFTIRMTAACTAETSVGFLVINK